MHNTSRRQNSLSIPQYRRHFYTALYRSVDVNEVISEPVMLYEKDAVVEINSG